MLNVIKWPYTRKVGSQRSLRNRFEECTPRPRQFPCVSTLPKGGAAEVYDAELLGLLRGLEAVIDFQQNIPQTNRRQLTIVLFADTTSSIEATTKENPGPSQQISQKFTETAMTFLDENRGATIEIS
jgi:hypothetical protein